jgi:hypothetical protein
MSLSGHGPGIPTEGDSMFKTRRPSPALAIAVLALFVSLGGSAVAATVVPLAKRALSADKAKVSENAKKLGGKTAAQLTTEAAAKAGPASSAAGLVTVRTGTFALNPGEERDYAIACASGEKALSGGFTYEGSALVQPADSAATADGSGWRLYLVNFSEVDVASGTLQAVCLR